MADGNNNPASKPKEMSMEVRLLLAFLLMGAVMFVTPYLFKTQTPPAPKKTADTQSAPVQTAAAPVPPPAAAAAPETAAVSGSAPTVKATVQQPLPPFVIDTDRFHVVFNNQGATVRSWQLKKYTGNDNKTLELTNPVSGLEYPFSLYFPGQKPTTNPNWAFFTPTPDADGLGITYEFSDGHTFVRKKFRFEKDNSLSQITAEVTVDGKPIPSMIEWRGGFGDLTVPNPGAKQGTLYYDVTANKLIEQKTGAAKNGPITANGNYSFAGLADDYFAAVLLPKSATTVQVVTFNDSAHTPLEEKTALTSGVAASDGDTNQFELYVGPKDVDTLKKVNPKLEQVVNFGWMSILAKPLFLIVNWLNAGFVHNFGWAIVVVTIIINFILFPLKLSNMKSMRKMQALKPQIDAINAKYKNVGIRDAKKADQNQEVMDLYKKYGVNPMGGCVPMLIQIPFFFAFYAVLKVSVEMRGAHWLWVTDLSAPEHLPIKILPIVMIASQFVMQKMTPQANADPAQQKMMMFMPLVFGFMFYNFPSGLVLYYLTSNLVNMGQQWFFNHTEAAQEAARSVEPPKKKIGRK